jgi:hypothetical protein
MLFLTGILPSSSNSQFEAHGQEADRKKETGTNYPVTRH